MTEQEGVRMHKNHEVRDLKQDADRNWDITVQDVNTKVKRKLKTKFIFIGAGGGSLLLLEKSVYPRVKVLAVSR